MRNLAAIFFLFFLTNKITTSTAANPSPESSRRLTPDAEFIKTSCNSTLYPKRCYITLSPYASEIGSDPKKLSLKALNVTLKVTKSTSRLMKRMSRIKGVQPRMAAAVADCVEEVGDAVEELENSVAEMGGEPSQGPDFCRVISDVQTWVSAAETDDDTCTEGFEEESAMEGSSAAAAAVKSSAVVNRNVKKIVEKHVARISRFTSNALALVNLYASSSESSHVPC
ncbi:Pectinesterase inhibitor 10 [Linum grandiflorum]